MRFRVATLNLEQDHKRWDARRDLIQAEIGRLKPDIMAFNEVCIPRQSARGLRDAATGTDRIQTGAANPGQRPVEGRGRGLAHPLRNRRDRQFRLPDKRHRGAGSAGSRRRRTARCLRDPPLHVARRQFAAPVPGSAIAGLDRHARRRHGIHRLRRLQRDPRRTLRRADGDPVPPDADGSRPRLRRSPTATVRCRIPTGKGWIGASITSGSQGRSRSSTAVFASTNPARKTRHCGPPTISACGPIWSSAASIQVCRQARRARSFTNVRLRYDRQRGPLRPLRQRIRPWTSRTPTGPA